MSPSKKGGSKTLCWIGLFILSTATGGRVYGVEPKPHPADLTDEATNPTLQPYAALTRQFLEAIRASKYDAAFEMLNSGNLRVLAARTGQDPVALQAEAKKKFLAYVQALGPQLNAALETKDRYQATRHDSANVSVHVPIDAKTGLPGGISFRLINQLNGDIKIQSFRIESGYPTSAVRTICSLVFSRSREILNARPDADWASRNRHRDTDR